MTFDEVMEHVFDSEGGWVRNPADPGGETKYGISKRAYPKEDIAALTMERAKELYRRDYWVPSRCDDLPEAIRLVHMDCAVNCGVGTAAKLLQEACRVAVDGKIGAVTLAAAKQANPDLLREEYLWLRVRYYARIARDRKQSLEFLPGWLFRLIRVRQG